MAQENWMPDFRDRVRLAQAFVNTWFEHRMATMPNDMWFITDSDMLDAADLYSVNDDDHAFMMDELDATMTMYIERVQNARAW